MDHLTVPHLESENAPKIAENEQGIPPGYMGVDIGPKTISLYSQELLNARTIFWNGPMGVFEKKSFANGTKALAEAIAKLHAIKVVGGGDSLAAIRQMNLAHRFTHLSTGGGAALEYIEFGSLPGIQALENARKVAL
jgi:phosphoglycerate kinase